MQSSKAAWSRHFEFTKAKSRSSILALATLATGLSLGLEWSRYATASHAPEGMCSLALAVFRLVLLWSMDLGFVAPRSTVTNQAVP